MVRHTAEEQLGLSGKPEVQDDPWGRGDDAGGVGARARFSEIN